VRPLRDTGRSFGASLIATPIPERVACFQGHPFAAFPILRVSA